MSQAPRRVSVAALLVVAGTLWACTALGMPNLPPDAGPAFLALLSPTPAGGFPGGFVLQSVRVDRNVVRYMFQSPKGACTVGLGSPEEGPAVAPATHLSCDDGVGDSGAALLEAVDRQLRRDGNLARALASFGSRKTAAALLPAPLSPAPTERRPSAWIRQGAWATFPVLAAFSIALLGAAWAGRKRRMELAGTVSAVASGLLCHAAVAAWLGRRPPSVGGAAGVPEWARTVAPYAAGHWLGQQAMSWFGAAGELALGGAGLAVLFALAHRIARDLGARSWGAWAAVVLVALHPGVRFLFSGGTNVLPAAVFFLATAAGAIAYARSASRSALVLFAVGAASWSYWIGGAYLAALPIALAAALGRWRHGGQSAARDAVGASIVALGGAWVALSAAAVVSFVSGIGPVLSLDGGVPVDASNLTLIARTGSYVYWGLALLGVFELRARLGALAALAVVAAWSPVLLLALARASDMATLMRDTSLLAGPFLTLVIAGTLPLERSLPRLGIAPRVALVAGTGLLLHFQWLVERVAPHP